MDTFELAATVIAGTALVLTPIDPQPIREEPSMTARPCWTCRQPATRTLTREGSITLNACDNCTRIDREEAERRGWTITPIGQWIAIGPRIDEFENDVHHFWKREINGIRFFFVHVKQSRLGQPYIGVSRLDTGELVRCSCPRDDCPFAA